MKIKNLPYAALLVVTLCYCCLVLVGAQSVRRADSADAVVRELYRVHSSGNGSVFEGRSRRQLDRFFSRDLADQIWKELTTHSDEVGNLDFDPLYNAQEILVSRFQVGKPSVEGDRAAVPVSFNNAGRLTKINFRLRYDGGAWKIENLVYDDGSDLVKILNGVF